MENKNKSEAAGKAGTVEILLCGDPLLRKKSLPITEINRDVYELVGRMSTAMYSHRGVGLAAPQIGVLKRIIVADTGQGLIALINPKILSSKGKLAMEEGCLSVPGLSLEIKRPEEVEVDALSIKGENVRLNLSGILARVVQHELDHLDGILIIDRVSKKKLKEAREKAKKAAQTADRQENPK